MWHQWRVYYIHQLSPTPYYVYRPHDTRKEAQEFIDANALVCRLPGMYVTYYDGKREWREYEDRFELRTNRVRW
jgi:hypothetical protein